MMQKPVTNACFMNITRFRIGDFEMLICRMRIFFHGKLAVKRDDVRHQISLEFLHVFPRSLAADEFLPRLEEIFERDDIIICMMKSNFGHNGGNQSINQSINKILPVLSKVKESYLLWYKFYLDLPKTHRHSLGQRIDTLFVEIIEAISAASFLSREEKHPYVRLAIKKADTLRVLLLVLWETKSIDDKKYIALSVKLAEAGKMLGGWNGQLTKQNSPAKAGEK